MRTDTTQTASTRRYWLFSKIADSLNPRRRLDQVTNSALRARPGDRGLLRKDQAAGALVFFAARFLVAFFLAALRGAAARRFAGAFLVVFFAAFFAVFFFLAAMVVTSLKDGS